MRLEVAKFWGFFVDLFAILVAAAMMAFPQTAAIGAFVMAGSFLALAGLIFNQIWPGPLEAVATRLRSRRIGNSDRYVVIADAARRLIEANPHSHLIATSREAGPPAQVIEWWGYWMAGNGIPLYGKRPPSTLYERVPSDIIGRGAFFAKGGAVLDGRDHPENHFTDISVKASDLRSKLDLPSVTERSASTI